MRHRSLCQTRAGMRRCRYHKCRKSFYPEKDFYCYCSWGCRVADVGPHYERDYRGRQRSYEQSYDRGYHDAWWAPPPGPEIPHGIWKGLMLFCHPDKWQDNPGLVTLATEVTRWLLEHRPREKQAF
jgi:hypothetical protein